MKKQQNLKLKGMIASCGLTYPQLAELSDVTTPTIQRAVNNDNININNARAICKALNCKLNDIFWEG